MTRAKAAGRGQGSNGGRDRVAWVLLGIVLVLPALRAGFFTDDFLQIIAQLERWSQSPAGPLDLFSFMPRDTALGERLRDAGVLPYFTATGLKLVFLRRGPEPCGRDRCRWHAAPSCEPRI